MDFCKDSAKNFPIPCNEDFTFYSPSLAEGARGVGKIILDSAIFVCFEESSAGFCKDSAIFMRFAESTSLAHTAKFPLLR
ncbi:hypothetical protein [Helicobacter sp. 23-1045]